jgi:hypothetical protein
VELAQLLSLSSLAMDDSLLSRKPDETVVDIFYKFKKGFEVDCTFTPRVMQLFYRFVSASYKVKVYNRFAIYDISIVLSEIMVPEVVKYFLDIYINGLMCIEVHNNFDSYLGRYII